MQMPNRILFLILDLCSGHDLLELLGTHERFYDIIMDNDTLWMRILLELIQHVND